MTNEQATYIEHAAYKVMSDEMKAEKFWAYYVPESLFPSIREFVEAVNKLAANMQAEPREMQPFDGESFESFLDRLYA